MMKVSRQIASLYHVIKLSFSNYLLNTYHVSGTVMSLRDIAVKKKHPHPHTQDVFK